MTELRNRVRVAAGLASVTLAGLCLAGLALGASLPGTAAQSEYPPAEEQYPPAGHQYGTTKILVCHKGKKTLRVAAPAWKGHRRHGDTLGPCNGTAAAKAKAAKAKAAKAKKAKKAMPAQAKGKAKGKGK